MPYSLILDSLILVLLAATIVYAARLSLYLKRFRDSKAELEAIITDLSRQVEKADKAISEMHQAAEESGRGLQDGMNRANAISDELQLIVEAGDSLAARLERLAVKSKGPGKKKADDDYDKRLETILRDVGDAGPAVKDGSAAASAIFAIRDPDIERGEDPAGGIRLSDEDSELLSDAERDLYHAMQSRKSRAGGKK